MRIQKYEIHKLIKKMYRTVREKEGNSDAENDSCKFSTVAVSFFISMIFLLKEHLQQRWLLATCGIVSYKCPIAHSNETEKKELSYDHDSIK